ncbi:nitroreductase [Streptomyces sp. NPDC101225]|uniref:nitroreductase n=1 Tax=Streptomyces sp. NPDC101225 TaxID=3366135 RepID=UPI003819AE34
MRETTSPLGLGNTAFGEIVTGRYSCRGFQPDQLPDDQVEYVLRAAQRTPSWYNAQAWEVHIVRGEAKDRLSEALLAAADPGGEPSSDFPLPTTYTGPRRDRRRAAGFGLYNAVGIARDDFEGRERQARENFTFFGAGQVAIVTLHEELGPYALADVGAYAATFCYAAQALGIGTIIQGAIGVYAGAVRKALDIPVEQRIVCGISFGRPDPSHPANGFRTERAELSEFVRWRDS